MPPGSAAHEAWRWNKFGSLHYSSSSAAGLVICPQNVYHPLVAGFINHLLAVVRGAQEATGPQQAVSPPCGLDSDRLAHVTGKNRSDGTRGWRPAQGG